MRMKYPILMIVAAIVLAPAERRTTTHVKNRRIMRPRREFPEGQLTG